MKQLALAAVVESDIEESAQTLARPRISVAIPRDYVPSAESAHELYHIDIEAFAGPLDLLLFLIRRHQIDVFDIPIAFICGKYLDYVRMMEDLNIDVAAEFMFMAAELVHIKSKMLLPKPPSLEGDNEEEDPRAELVRRLLEYQKFKMGAESLAELPRHEWDTFGRPPEAIPEREGGAPLREVGVFALVQAFNAILKRQRPEVRHHVIMEQVSMRKRMYTLAQVLAGEASLRFEQAINPGSSRLEIIVTFLAVLEMTRLKLLRVYESDDGVLYLRARFDSVDVAYDRIDGVGESDYAG